MSDLKKLRKIVTEGNVNHALNELEDTALHYAVFIEHTDVIKFLLSLRADIQIQNQVLIFT